jgi:hypothetical protein
MLAARYTNLKPDPRQLFKILYEPYMSLWFLYTLFITLMLFAGLVRAGAGKAGLLIFSALLFLAARALEIRYGVVPVWPAGRYVADCTIYFALGVALSDRLLPLARSAAVLPMVAISLAGFALMTLLVNYGWGLNPWLKVVTALLGITSLYALSVVLGTVGMARGIRLWGVASMEIYLIHEMVGVAARVLLRRELHTSNIPLHLIVGTVGGLYVPIALARLYRRFTVFGPTPARPAPPRPLPTSVQRAAA